MRVKFLQQRNNSPYHSATHLNNEIHGRVQYKEVLGIVDGDYLPYSGCN